MIFWGQDEGLNLIDLFFSDILFMKLFFKNFQLVSMFVSPSTGFIKCNMLCHQTTTYHKESSWQHKFNGYKYCIRSK